MSPPSPSPGLPSREPQVEVVDDGRRPVADGVPVLRGDVAGGEVSTRPPEGSLQRDLLKGGQDLESWKISRVKCGVAEGNLQWVKTGLRICCVKNQFMTTILRFLCQAKRSPAKSNNVNGIRIGSFSQNLYSQSYIQ